MRKVAGVNLQPTRTKLLTSTNPNNLLLDSLNRKLQSNPEDFPTLFNKAVLLVNILTSGDELTSVGYDQRIDSMAGEALRLRPVMDFGFIQHFSALRNFRELLL